MAKPAGVLVVAPTALSRKEREFLDRTSAEVRSRLKTAAGEMLVVGQLLLEARRRVGNRKFMPWLRSDDGPGVKKGAAYRLMAVAKAFGGLNADALRRVPKCVLYTLSQSGVPQAVRERVAEDAAAGKPVTRTDAMQLVDQYTTLRKRPTPHPAGGLEALLATLKPGAGLYVTAGTKGRERMVTVAIVSKGRKQLSATRPDLRLAVAQLAAVASDK